MVSQSSASKTSMSLRATSGRLSAGISVNSVTGQLIYADGGASLVDTLMPLEIQRG